MSLPGPYTRAGILIYAVPLYAGPLLAGLSKAPLATLPVFAAAFALLALRGRMPDLSTGGGCAALALLLAVQLGLVALVCGLGRLLALPFGPLPLPVWLPLASTLAATGFAWWRYRDAGRLDAMLDDALAQVAAAAHRPETDPDRTFSELLAGMDEGDATADLAAMRYLLQPRPRAMLLTEPRLGMALTLGLTSLDDPVRDAAQAVARLLIAENARASAFPPPDRLPAIAAAFPDTAETAAAIAAHLEDLP